MAKISITLSDINTIISKLNSSSDTIEQQWKSIKTEEIEKIKSSWIGEDCDAYISKILELDDQVVKAIQAQRLLAETYKSAKDQIESTQASNKADISRL